jgi:hypothetical protein
MSAGISCALVATTLPGVETASSAARPLTATPILGHAAPSSRAASPRQTARAAAESSRPTRSHARNAQLHRHERGADGTRESAPHRRDR